MIQYVAIALLCLSAVSAQYVVSNLYTSDDCSGTATISQGYPVNVCIVGVATSSYYGYDAANPGSFNSSTYTSKDCSGSTFTSVTNFSTCSFRTSYTYSATVPKFNGYVTLNSATCGGAAIGTISSLNLGVCTGLTASTSLKYVWYGGSQCVLQQFDSADCSGTADQSPVGYSCTDDFFNADVQSVGGCQINGAYLPASNIGPSYPSNAQVTVTKQYELRNDCTGQVVYTTYSRLATCDGKGSATAIVNNKVTVSVYDNYNCTGVLLDTIEGTTVGLCNKDEFGTGSSISTTGSFPSSVNSPVATIQSSCTGTPTIYSAVVASSGCIQFNSTHSGSIASCSTTNNGTVVLVTNTYATTGCTGAIVETDTEYQAPCETYATGLAAKFACSAQFSPSSSASNVAVAFSVMIMSLIAALMM